MNTHHHPVPTTLLDGIDGIDGSDGSQHGCCRCERDCPADCPAEWPEQAEATITLTTTQVADLVELLDEIDQFLRMGDHSIDALTDFYRTHHDDHHPRFVALCLVDSISFTALGLRQQAQAAGIHPATTGGADQ